jgi:penicillin-insensitive murein endopeptidase
MDSRRVLRALQSVRRQSAWLLLVLGGALGCSGATPPHPDPSATPEHAGALPADPSQLGVAEAQAQPQAPAKTASSPPPDAGAAPPASDDVAAALALDGSHSVSVGSPSHGKLLGGVPLPDRGPGFVHNTERPDEARYGTVELVQAIINAAAVVERELPGSGLTVNDLGLPQGGPIRQHGSHENGRDADILFYMLDQKGKPIPAVGVPIDPEGKGTDYQDLSIATDDLPERLDVRRTWRFVQALLERDGEQVQRIFLVEHVRAMLLAHAERMHAPVKLRDRFADLTCQPETPHDDHMHVRLFCTPEDIGQGCWDKPPIYPWHRAALKALGLSPVFEPASARGKDREEMPERTTSREQAKKKAGVLHRKVREFLKQREVWAKKPSPGRMYCR